MARITDLSVEIIAAIFEELGPIQNVFRCLPTCQLFYYSYHQYYRLEIRVLKKHVSLALLPFAIAVHEVSILHPYKVTKLLKTLQRDPDMLVERLYEYPLDVLIKIGNTHDLVEKHAKSYALEAWECTKIPPHGQPRHRFPQVSDRLSLSAEETFRFCRALYHIELYARLSDVRHNPFESRQTELFFSGHSPWENEQIACAYDYLGRAIERVVFHTKHLVMGIDRSNTRWLNVAKQSWISQGLDWIDHLENANSDNDRLSLLFAAFQVGWFALPDVLGETVDDYLGSTYVFVDGVPTMNLDEEDSDKGPSEAWKQSVARCSKTEPRPARTWIARTEPNRRCAYVFWDWGRIQRHDMNDLFNGLFWGGFET